MEVKNTVTAIRQSVRKKNIPVYLEETLHFHTVEQGFLAEVFPERTVVSQPEQAGHGQSGILCHERAQCHAFHFHPQCEHEKQTGCDVDNVLCDGDILGKREFCMPIYQPVNP